MLSQSSLITRLQSLTRLDPDTGCHVFTGGMNSTRPYPLIASEEDGRKPVLAYRAAYELRHKVRLSELPPPTDGADRHEVHHVCENKLCCNPDHLVLVTRKEHAAIHTFERRWKKAVSKLSRNGTGVFIGGLQEAA